LFALVYSSVATGGGDDFDALLATCRRNNERDDVTGCLLYVYDDRGGSAYFAQMLEGDQETVEAVYARIGPDRRHREVRLLSSGPTPARRFADSPMRLAELPGDRVLPSAAVPVEAVMREVGPITRLLASYGDDAPPLSPASF
jgi:hypothetical protein